MAFWHQFGGRAKLPCAEISVLSFLSVFLFPTPQYYYYRYYFASCD